VFIKSYETLVIILNIYTLRQDHPRIQRNGHPKKVSPGNKACLNYAGSLTKPQEYIGVKNWRV
jgi:hypothetical protein